MFSVRIVKVDHYIAPPIRGLDVCYSEFRNCQITKVPVIRIFGPTPAGQKVCVHLHGTFPYIYIPYDGTEPADRYMHQLAAKLDQALSTNQAGIDSGGVQWVHKIELVSGIPFYGYHAKEHQFLKIYFLNPKIIERALELLQSGAIMNHSFQPHEAHIPYILQVFLDYNLYGMNLIKFQNIKFRRKSKTSDTITSKESLNSSLMDSLTESPNVSYKIWDPDNLPSAFASDDSVIKQSLCELEVDVLDVDVVNSLDFAGSDMNPGIAAIWEDEKQRRRQMGQLSQITPQCSQDRQPTVGTRSEVEYLEKVKQKLCLVTDSQEMSFILDESQVHEKSGVESKSQNDSFTTCVESSLEGTPVVSCSQASNKDSILDDNDFRELLLDLMNSEAEHVDHYDHIHSPTSPHQAIKDDDENDDEIIMSQVVPSDAVEGFGNPSQSIIQGASRLPPNDNIPQVDGPNDPKDKCKGSPNSMGRHKMSTTRTHTSPQHILDNSKGVLNQGNIEPVLAEKMLVEAEKEKNQCLSSDSPSMVEKVDFSPRPVPKQDNESKGTDSENDLQSVDAKTEYAAENTVSAARAVKQPSRLSLRSHVQFQRTCVANRELMRTLPIRKSLRQIVSGKMCDAETNGCGKIEVVNTSENETSPCVLPQRKPSRLSLRSGRNLSAQCKILDSASSTDTEKESLVKAKFNENVVNAHEDFQNVRPVTSDSEDSSCESFHSSKQRNSSQRSRGRGRPRGRGRMGKDFKTVVNKKDDQQKCEYPIIQEEPDCTAAATNFTETCIVLESASSTDTEKVSLVKTSFNESSESVQNVRDSEDSSCESHQSSPQSSRGRGRGRLGMDLKNFVDKKDDQQNDVICTTATSVTKTWYRGRRGRGRGRGRSRSRRTNHALDQRSAKDFQESSEQEEMYVVIVEEIPNQATSNVSEFAVSRSAERSDQGRWSYNKDFCNISAKNGKVPELHEQHAMADMPNLSESPKVPNLVETSLFSEIPILTKPSPLPETPNLGKPPLLTEMVVQAVPSPLAEMPILKESSPLAEMPILTESSPIPEMPNLEKPPLLTEMAIQAVRSPLAEMPNLQEPSAIMEDYVPSKSQPAASERCALKESFSLEEPSTLKQMPILTKASNELTFSKQKEMLGEAKSDFQVPIARLGRPRLRRQICVRNVMVNVDSTVGLRELCQLGFESLMIRKCQSSKISNEINCLDVSSNSAIGHNILETDITEERNRTGKIKNTAIEASLNVQLPEDKTSEDVQPPSDSLLEVISRLKDRQVEDLHQPDKACEDFISDAETVVLDDEYDVKKEEEEVVLTDDTEIYELKQTSRRIILKVSKVSKNKFGDGNHLGSRTSKHAAKDSLWKCKIVGQTEEENFISGDDSDESLRFTPRERKCKPIIESSYTEESQGNVSSSTENDLRKPAKRQRKWRRIVKDSSSRSDSDESWNSKTAKSKSRCKKKQQRRRIVKSSDSEDEEEEDTYSEISGSTRRVRQLRKKSYCENGKLDDFIIDSSESESSSVKVSRSRRRRRSCRKSSYCEDSDYELQDAYDDTFAAFGRKNYSLRNNFGKIHDLAVEMRPSKRRTGVDYAPNAYASFYDPEAIGVEGWRPTNKAGRIGDFASEDEPDTSIKEVKDPSLDPFVRIERLDEDTIEKYLLGQIPFPETTQVATVAFEDTVSASESEDFNSRCPSLTRATSSSDDDDDHRPTSPCHVSDQANDNDDVPEDSNTASSSTYVALGNSPTADRFSPVVDAPCEKIQIEKATPDDGERYAPFEDVLYKLAWLSPIPENEKAVVRKPVLTLLRARSPTEMQIQNVSATHLINTSATQPSQPGSAPKQSSSERQHDNLPLHGSLPEPIPQPTNPGCASQNTRLMLRQEILQKQSRQHHSSNQSAEKHSFPHCNATPSSQERFQYPGQQLPHAGAHSYSFNLNILENRQAPTLPSIQSGSCNLPERAAANSQQQIPRSSSSLPSLGIPISVNSQFQDFRMQNAVQPLSRHYQNLSQNSDQGRMQNFIGPGASPLHHYAMPPQSIPQRPFTDFSTPNSLQCIQSTIMPSTPSSLGSPFHPFQTQTLQTRFQSGIMPPTQSPQRSNNFTNYSSFSSQEQLQSALMPPPPSPRLPDLSGYSMLNSQAQMQSTLMAPLSSPRRPDLTGYSTPNLQAQLQSPLLPPSSSPRGSGLAAGYSALNSQAQLQHTIMSSAPYPRGSDFAGYSTPNSQERLQATFMSPSQSTLGPRFAECFTPNSQERFPAPEMPSSRRNIYSFNPEIMQGTQYPGNMPASSQGQIYHRGIPATSPRGPAYSRSLEQMQRPRFPGCSISNSQYQRAPMSSPSVLQMQLAAPTVVDLRSQTQQRHCSAGLQQNFQEQFQHQSSHQAGTSSNSANANGPAATSVYVKNINTMVSQTIEYYLNGSPKQPTFMNSNATQASQMPQNQYQGMQNYCVDKNMHKPPPPYSTNYSQNRMDNNNGQLNGSQMQDSQRNSFINSQLALAFLQNTEPPLPAPPPPPPSIRSVHEIRNSMDSLGFDQIRNPYLQVLLDKNPVYTAFHRPQNIRIVKRRGPRKTAAAKLIRKMCMAGRILMPEVFFKSHGFTVRLTVRSGRSVYPPVIKPVEVRPIAKRGRPKLNKLRTKVMQQSYPYNNISKIRGRQRSHCKSNMVTRQVAKQEDSRPKVPRGPPKSMPILNSSDKPLVKTFDTPTPNSAFPPARKQTAKRSIGIRRGMASTRGSFPTSNPSTVMPPPPSVRGALPRGMRRGCGRPPLSSRGNGSDRSQVIESLGVLQSPASVPRRGRPPLQRNPTPREPSVLESLALITEKRPEDIAASILLDKALVNSDDEINLDLSPLDEIEPEWFEQPSTLFGKPLQSEKMAAMLLLKPEENDKSGLHEEKDKSGLHEEKDDSGWNEEEDVSGWHEEKDTSNWNKENPKASLREEKDESGWNEEEDVSGWHEETDTSAWHKENPKASLREEKDESGWNEDEDVSGWHEEKDTSAWHKETPKASLREEKDESGWHEEEDVSGWHEEKDTSSWHKENPPAKSSLDKEKDESGWHEEDDVSGWHEETDTAGWHDGKNASGCIKEKPSLPKEKDESGWHEEEDTSGWIEGKDTSGWNEGKDESGWNEGKDESGWNEGKDESGWNEGKDESGWNEGKDESGWNEGKDESGWNEGGDTSGNHKKKKSSVLPPTETYSAWREKRGLSGWNEKKDPSGLDEKKNPSDCQEKKNSSFWDEVLGAATSSTDEQSNNTATTSSASSRIPFRFRKKPVVPAPSFEAVEMAHKKSDVLTKYKRDFKRIMGERPKLADNEILSSLMVDNDNLAVPAALGTKIDRNYAVKESTGISEDRESIVHSPEPGQSANNEVGDSPVSSKFFSPMLSALQFDTTLDEDPLLVSGMSSKRYSKQTDGIGCLSDYLDVNEDEPFGKSAFNSYITLGSSPEPADHLIKDDLTSKPTSSSLFESGMDNFDNYMPETPCGHNSPDMFDSWCEDIRPTQTFADAMTFPVGSPPELTDISDSVVSRDKEEFSQQKPINSLSESSQDGLGFVAAIAEGINEFVNMQKHSLGSSSVAEADAIKDPAEELFPALSTCHDEIDREEHVLLERAVEELDAEVSVSNTKADVTMEETINLLPAVDSAAIVPYQTISESTKESSKSLENLIQNDKDVTPESAKDVTSDSIRSPDNPIDLSQEKENSQGLISGDATPDNKLTKGAISDSIDSTPKMTFYNENTLAEKTITDTDIADTPVRSFYIYPNSEPASRISTPVDVIKEDINMEVIPASQHGVPKTNVLTYYIPPPSPATILSSMSEYKIPETRHPVAHCSNATDVPTKSVQLGGGAIILKLQSKSISDLPEFDGPLCSTGLNHWCQVIKIAEEAGYACSNDCRKNMACMGKPLLHQGLCLEFHPRPPLASEVQKWLDGKMAEVKNVEEKKDYGRIIKNATDKDVAKGAIFPIAEISPISYPAVRQTCDTNVERHDIRSPLVPSLVLNHGQKKRRLSFSCDHELSRESKEDPKFCSSPKPDSPECPVITSPRSRRMKRSFSDGDSAEMECSLDELDMSCSPSSTGPVAKKGKWASSTPHKPTPARESCFRTRSPAQDSAQGFSLRRQLFLQQMKTNVQTETSQLQGPTPKNTYGFKMSGDVQQDTKSIHIYQHITLMSMELHVQTEEDLCPNPQHNSICAIFYHVHHDIPVTCENKLDRQDRRTGIILVEASLGQDSKSSFRKHAELIESDVDVLIVQNEFNLVQEFVKIMQKHDPDILLGFEIQMLSWGYLCERCSTIGIKVCPLLSRVPDDSMNIFRPPQEGLGDTFVLNIVGRIILNVWQVLKSELALYNYTFENLAYHVLHKRIPLFSFRTLTLWYGQSPNSVNRWRTLQHYIIRTKGNVQLLEQLNFIGKTSELARLFGIQFYEVLSRGTQFRVESMLLRQCRKKKYIAVSPSVQQRSTMRSPEYIPLVMEPVSKFHTNPVVVLDFQSLYPSIIIAYNYCFSTCIGRVEDIGQSDAFKFGCTTLKIPSGLLKKFQDRITVAPCGVAFVKSEIRKGILPRMLEEILTSRIMVKTTMKQHVNDKPLYSMLDARQLGLKLISNVTYGYTAANFSGRMPCVEIADSVVSKGRETLERAISLIHETARWNAKVVYGDTDSVFVLLEGRSKEQAFAIGKEISQAVTAQNPKPVKLKLEKVYLPCVLETKKRYVGNMFETPEQIEPVFDAKGIETVRRDGCPAVAKILEKSLRILFKTHDVSQVKAYVQNQFHKILMSRCSLNDYIFTREYHGRNGYQQANYAPAFKIARSLVQSDSRAEPRIGERVPYVVTYGSPGAILLDLICHPHDVLLNSSLCLNAKYYINNAICPALDRVFSLLGADVRQWYSTLPRSTNLPLPIENPSHDGNTILHHFTATKCPVCEASAHSGICPNCLSNPQKTLIVLTDRIRQWERRYQQISMVCQGCTGATDKRISCVSLNCPIFFRLGQSSKDLAQAPYLRGLLKKASLNW